MNGIKKTTDRPGMPVVAVLAAIGVSLQWLSQPPIGAWPIAFVALVPWLAMICHGQCVRRQGAVVIWLAGLVYWMVTLQGLRHAHPVIYVGWFALAAYLSCYGVLFVALSRRLLRCGWSLWATAPVIWVGLECLRNYFATGISAAMLGHTMADVPTMIQIADTFGSYGVSFMIVAVNVALYHAITHLPRAEKYFASARYSKTAIALGVLVLVATLLYGRFRLGENAGGKQLSTFALIQRNEAVEYVEDPVRNAEMFNNYARQSLAAVAGTSQRVDAIVWPESMFSGGSFWVADSDQSIPPDEFPGTKAEFQQFVEFHRDDFLRRAIDLQNAFAASNTDRTRPDLIGGCGVFRYVADPQMFSGIVHIPSDGRSANWYGKTHRMMFGEYIPVLSSVPFLRPYIPLGLRLTKGPGPKRFMVGETNVSPNICIETAVERVTINHLAQLHRDGSLPDVIVTVTNDGWFDDSSVIDHHLRCAQLVAVGCRRPILSSANNGPTAWIDSRGRITERLETGSEGAIIATPVQDNRNSLYLRIGDWPARMMAAVCVVLIAMSFRDWYSQRRKKAVSSHVSSALPK